MSKTVRIGHFQASVTYKSVVYGEGAKEKRLAIKVGPNPLVGEGVVSFDADHEGMYTFIVSTQDGKTVYESSVLGVEGTNYFNFNSFSYNTGIYIFIIKDEKGNTSQERVVVK